jgi:O-antigen ligase
MNFTAVNRPPDPAQSQPRPYSDPEKSRIHPLWLLILFVAFGFTISTTVSMLAGSKPYGVLLAAAGIIFAIPMIALMIQALPQALEKYRMLRKNWTWWHWLWFGIFFSMLVFRIRDVGEAKANPLDAWAMTRILPETAVALTLIIRLLLKRPNWLKALFTGIPGMMAIYCVVCIISSAWSVNAGWTAYKSFEFLADVSLIACIVAGATGFATYQNLIDWTLTFYGLSLVGVWINVPIFPVDAWDGGRLTGVVPVEASNSVGTSGAVLALIAICRLWPLSGKARSKAWYIFLFIFGMVSMVLSQTRNAEGAWLFAVVLVILFVRRLRQLAVWSVVAAAPLVIVSFLLDPRLWEKAYKLAITFAARDQSTEAVGSLSGRTAWWAYGLQLLAQHPWTGMGAYAAGRFAVLGKLGVGAAAMMHSDWIEVAIGTSFWGIVPFAAALFCAWYYLIRAIRSDRFTRDQRQLALECFALLGMLTLHSFFNDELSWHCPLLYFAILGYAEFTRTRGKAEHVYAARPGRSTQLATAQFVPSLSRSSLNSSGI